MADVSQQLAHMVFFTLQDGSEDACQTLIAACHKYLTDQPGTVYWSVGRGLADARARGKTILRLRVALEDGGWNLTSASARVSAPVPTPDRLKTALNLAKECELLPA